MATARRHAAVPFLLLLLFVAASLPALMQSALSQEPSVEVQAIAKGLEVPWSMAFSPDGRLFVTERPGRIRVVKDGSVGEPVAELEVAAVGEGGLLGLALSPDFERNRFVFVYYTYQGSDGRLWNRVARLTEDEREGTLGDHTVILDFIPGAGIHDGGRIRFGPDGKLYVGTGDARQSRLAQDPTSLAGKILRINPDGTIPDDNPFSSSSSPVYSLGHRNVQGLDWHPLTGQLFATEHGPSGEKGFAHDEVNLIRPGANYGWPEVVGTAGDPRYADPVLESGDVTWAPSGASFYRGDRIPEWKHRFFFTALRGRHLHMVTFAGPDYVRVEDSTELFTEYGRLRDVITGPDGFLYFSTSNRDGRGNPAPDDDRIFRVVPRDPPAAPVPAEERPIGPMVLMISTAIAVAASLSLYLLIRSRRSKAVPVKYPGLLAKGP